MPPEAVTSLSLAQLIKSPAAAREMSIYLLPR